MNIVIRIALAALSLGITVAPLAARAHDALCPLRNATLSGAYMSIGGGTVVGLGPIAFVGKITFDGEGNFVNPFTASLNGAIVRAELVGTYTVNGDCTGSFTATDGSSFDFVVSPDGSKLDYVRTNANTISNGTAARLKDRD